MVDSQPQNVTLPDIIAFANVVKDLEMRSSWISTGPKSNNKTSSQEREKEKTQAHTKEDCMKSEADLAPMLSGAQGSREETRKDSSLEPATLPTLRFQM